MVKINLTIKCVKIHKYLTVVKDIKLEFLKHLRN